MDLPDMEAFPNSFNSGVFAYTNKINLSYRTVHSDEVIACCASMSHHLSIRLNHAPFSVNTVVFHRVCPAEHGNLYGEKRYFRTDEPATSIGTDLPGVIRTDCIQAVSCRHRSCSGGAAAKNPHSLTGLL